MEPTNNKTETTGSTMKTLKAKVYSIDVWGNAEDGWEQNDYSECDIIEVQIPADNAAILAVLQDVGLVRATVKLSDCEFEWFGDTYELEGELRQAKDQKPVYQFRAVSAEVK